MLVLLLFMAGCEDIYQPDLENGEDFLVVDARIIAGGGESQVMIYKTKSFNEVERSYPPVTTAEVSLVDTHGGVLPLSHAGGGKYQFTGALTATESYKLVVQAEGERFESDFQQVPAPPSLDTVYVVPGEILVEGSKDEATGELRKEEGAWLYADISSKGEGNYYRFTSRKVCQYSWLIERGMFPPITMYAWLSLKPWEIFNVAGPAEYSSSTDIRRHPLVFLERSYSVFVPDRPVFFLGWIYICHQYAISRDSYDFYKELNSLLSAEGKLFDPLYTQVRGNLTCTSDRGKVILGNFEISRVREYRFFVEYQGREGYFFKKIPWFFTIPSEGSLADETPDWWEIPNREYPKTE